MILFCFLKLYIEYIKLKKKNNNENKQFPCSYNQILGGRLKHILVAVLREKKHLFSFSF